MATTFRLESQSYDGRYMYLSCTQEKDVENNKSIINWTLTVTGGDVVYYSTGPTTVKINGKEVYYKDRTSYTTQAFPAARGSVSGTIEVDHNSNGSKAITCSITTAFYTTTTQTKSGNWTLDDIPRASSVTATNANIGSATTIKISRASSSFTHTITYSFSGLTGTIATKTTSTSVSWTVPTSFYAKIPNAKTGTCTLTCETFNGSTSIGSKTTTFTVTASESSSKPTLSPTIVDTNSVTIALTGDSSKLVKYCSTASTDSNAAARNSATIKSQKTTNGSKSITTETGTFSKVENAKFTFSATDSRGYTATSTKTVTMVNYVKLTCNLSVAQPTTAGVTTITVKGNYFNGSFGAVSNTLTVEYRFKENDGTYSNWIALSPTKSGNTYTCSGGISGLNYQNSYTFQARAIDKIYTGNTAILSAEKRVKTTPIFDWGEDDFKFNVPVIFPNGGTSIRGTTTTGKDVQAFAPCNANNNCVIGYGGYGEKLGGTNLYGNDINILTNTDVTINRDDETFSVLGAVRALTYGYSLDCTTTVLGDNYSAAEVTCYLIGNQLRMGLNCTRKEATGVGNITNETVCTFRIKHNKRIRNLYMVGFTPAATGATASFVSSASTVVDDDNLDVTITLAATTSASSNWTAYWIIPVTINLSAYV